MDAKFFETGKTIKSGVGHGSKSLGLIAAMLAGNVIMATPALADVTAVPVKAENVSTNTNNKHEPPNHAHHKINQSHENKLDAKASKAVHEVKLDLSTLGLTNGFQATAFPVNEDHAMTIIHGAPKKYSGLEISGNGVSVHVGF